MSNKDELVTVNEMPDKDRLIRAWENFTKFKKTYPFALLMTDTECDFCWDDDQDAYYFGQMVEDTITLLKQLQT